MRKMSIYRAFHRFPQGFPRMKKIFSTGFPCTWKTCGTIGYKTCKHYSISLCRRKNEFSLRFPQRNHRFSTLSMMYPHVYPHKKCVFPRLRLWKTWKTPVFGYFLIQFSPDYSRFLKQKGPKCAILIPSKGQRPTETAFARRKFSCLSRGTKTGLHFCTVPA